MIRFLALALGAFLLPGLLYYLWRLYAPARLGGMPALAEGGLPPMPWRWLAIAGAVCLAVSIVTWVSVFDDTPPPFNEGDDAPGPGG